MPDSDADGEHVILRILRSYLDHNFGAVHEIAASRFDTVEIALVRAHGRECVNAALAKGDAVRLPNDTHGGSAVYHERTTTWPRR